MSEDSTVEAPQVDHTSLTPPHPPASPDSGSQPPPARRSLGRGVEQFGALLVLVLSVIVFSVLRPQTFPTSVNATSILLSQSVLALITLGLLMVLVVGEFDLSLGFVVDFCTMLFGSMAFLSCVSTFIRLSRPWAPGPCYLESRSG
jgi:ribose transport system permease protein